MNEFPYVKDLVLIGGGHTHALVLRKWGMNPLAGVKVTLIDPGPTAAYSGMLPGFIAGLYSRADLGIDLVRLARFANARVIIGAVNAIDPVAKLITVPGRPPIAYDVCAIDVGITSDMPGLKGFAEHAVPAKPLTPFAKAWVAYRATAKDPKVAIIGGGVAGAELAMAMSHALHKDGHQPNVTLVDRSKVLTALQDTTQARMRKALKENGVEVLEDSPIAEVTAEGVVLEDGRLVLSDFTTGAAGAKPHDWHGQTGLELHDGYITVNSHLQTSDADVFAVGDCAHMAASPRPKAGVYAVRQAPVLFDNLRATLSDGRLKTYTPQNDYLKLISLGEKSALAEKWGQVLSGPMMWRWKDQIDRKFMDQFSDLKIMGQPDLPQDHAAGLNEALGEKPMCGGCGAKVGSGALTAVLSDLPDLERSDVKLLPGDDAGIIDGRQVISTDHLRAFVEDPVVMTRIAAVHALGDIWSMGAKPQAATVNLILPKMSEALQQRVLQEIMTSASEVLSNAGAAIVGGHTSLGSEMTIGFTITGLCDEPITHGGAKDGDVLILTKPIGTGVIMAAEMQGDARGDIVVAALDSMMKAQGDAAEILKNAHAMTDVTGFGLAGHLNGICQASGLGAQLNLDDVPVLMGAEDLANAGHSSSLFPSNRLAVEVSGKPSAKLDLLFDPQTAGGLLAAVGAKEADEVLVRLKEAGYPAAIIGTLTKGLGIKAD